jgi:RimJ/RimL family protein N-acetyltransferase
VSLEDDEIRLRPFTDEDVPAIVTACQDPEIPRWTRVPAPYTHEDAREFVQASAADGASFAIVDRRSGELLGSIGARRLEDNFRIGYWVKREARGRGVATRALRLVARFAVEELGAARVELITDPANAASQRVAEKAGFTCEARLRSYYELKGRRSDALMYSLLPQDLLAAEM